MIRSKKVVVIVCFLFLLLKVTGEINDILMPVNDSVDSLREEKAPIDVMFFGSSHAFANINPVTLWREYGIAAQCVGAGEQAMPYTYYTLREAVKVQRPKVAVVEVYMAIVDDNYFDDKRYPQFSASFTNFRPSLEKLEIVYKFCRDVPEVNGNEINAALGFPGYHQRYTELEKNDFERIYDNRGFQIIYESNPQDKTEFCPTSQITEGKPMSVWAEKYLSDMISFCEDKGISLMFLVTPYRMLEEHAAVLKTVSDLAEKRSIPFIDMNNYIDEIGMDYNTDFADWGHANNRGSAKVSKWLGSYLTNHYGLENQTGDKRYKNWERLSEIYEQLENNYWLIRQTQLDQYIQHLKNPDYLVVLLAGDVEADNVLKAEYYDAFGITYEPQLEAKAFMIENSEIMQLDMPGEHIRVCRKDTIGIIKNSDGILCKVNNQSYTVNGEDRIIVYDKKTKEIVDQVVIDWENKCVVR